MSKWQEKMDLEQKVHDAERAESIAANASERARSALRDFLEKMAFPDPPKKIRSCNRHSNCDEGEAKAKADVREPGANFHCWTEDCEDCFGK